MSHSNTSNTSTKAQYVPEHNIPERDMTLYTGAQHAATVDTGLSRMSQSARSSMERLNLNENYNHIPTAKTNLHTFQPQQQQQQQRNQVLSSIDYNSNYGINRLGIGDTHYTSVNNLATHTYASIDTPPSYATAHRTLYLQQQRSIHNRIGYYAPNSGPLQSDEVLYVHPLQPQQQQQPLPQYQHQHQPNFYQTYEDASKDEIIERLKAKLAQADQEIYVLQTSNSGFINKLEELQGITNEFKTKFSQKEELKVQLKNIELRLNQREYDIQEMKKHHKMELDEEKNQKNQLKVRYDEKTKIENELKESLSKQQKDIDLYKRKIKDLESHIYTLPNKDEYDDIKKQVDEAREQIENYKVNKDELERKYKKSKHIIQQKDDEINNLKKKIDNQAIEYSNLQLKFEEFERTSKEVHELIYLRIEYDKIKTENESTRKLFENMLAKNAKMENDFKSEINSLKDQIENNINDTIVLKNDLEEKDCQIAQLKCTIKELNISKNNLNQLILDQMNKIKSYETIASAEYQRILITLCCELENNSNLLNELIQNCINIYEGGEIDVTRLVTSKVTKIDKLQEHNLCNGFVTQDFLNEKLRGLQGLSDKMNKMRYLISDNYAQIIAGQAGVCNQQ